MLKNSIILFILLIIKFTKLKRILIINKFTPFPTFAAVSELERNDPLK